jgi:hypothetical protein
MQNQVVIQAKIGSRTYKIKVEESKEGTVREILARIAEKIHQFKIEFAGLDEQDYLAMVLLDHITSSAAPVTNDALTEQRLQTISHLLNA